MNVREVYRKTASKDAKTGALKLTRKLLAKFPEGTFTKDHSAVIDAEQYSKSTLIALTEAIWAFSLGPVLDDLGCPQTATDLYSYFILYQT